MAPQLQSSLTIWRRKQVECATGYSRSTIYWRISEGLFIKPVSLGARAVGYPSHEVQALNAARIAGKSDDEIRALVKRLIATRASALAELTTGDRHDA